MTGFAALPVAEDGGQNDDVHLVGVSKIQGPRWLQLPIITIGLLGVQVLWSIEMSYGTPYLLSLGLTKSAVAMVFLAGPISGLVVQPLIGVLADNSRSRFGRRRPYMLIGVLICTSAMLLLGFTRPFATIFTSSGSTANDILTIWLAVLAIFGIDFSINAVQAVDRALLVDTLPPSEQPDGNAWAARMLGVGSVAGYFIGNVDMTKVFPFLGNTELEVLSVVGSLLLIASHVATAVNVKEKVVVSSQAQKKGLLNEMKEIWVNAKSLPSTIFQICLIQFFAWLGWFPLLFNTTEFIAELYKRAHPELTAEIALEEGARLGSRAMFYNAILSLVASIFLPFFVAEATSRRSMQETLSTVPPNIWIRWFNKLKVHLASLWAASHMIFAVCMLATFFYSGVFGATLFTTLSGFSWAVTQWAPFALLADAILSDQGDEDASSILLDDTRSRRISQAGSEMQDPERQFLVGNDDGDEHPEDEVHSFRSSASMDEDRNRPKPEYGSLMQNDSARMSHLDVHGVGGSGSHLEVGALDHNKPRDGNLAAKAGIILGIHNVFIVIPQFIITGISSIIFAITGAGETPELPLPSGNSTVSGLVTREGISPSGGGPNSYAYIFRLGGISAIVAFVLTVKLARHLKHTA
ncbi:major facilitator superfamily domain-containing protein [Irpex rosettiformis]|uniref:Major facilitator superfamily domain-containing protein n=1 Tax=Irpex rosettiformis TaxID=378272 RepID=A0ACB8U2D9_9APHY|nr:major facilitator superfamily domain-containing protein [Irpex rosettiformis]